MGSKKKNLESAGKLLVDIFKQVKMNEFGINSEFISTLPDEQTYENTKDHAWYAKHVRENKTFFR